MKHEPPVPGAVRITLQAPPTFKVPSYCNGGTYPCVFWSEDAIRYPDDGAGVAFFTTRVSSTNYVPPPGCDFSKARLPTDPCFFDPNSPTIRRNTLVPTSFIGDIEDYTMMIEHSVRGKITSVAIRNGLLDGALMSHDGKLIRNFNNATRMGNNSRADGDIFTVKEMLDAAGANLDGPSTAPGANKTIGEINRTSGIVVVIVIEYKNRYIPQVIEGNEYKAVERITNVTDGSVTLVNRHGIRFVFQQHGTIGQFDFLTLLTNIVGGLALFKLAEALVEFLMLMVLPEKEFYGIAKFQETNSFDEWREYKKQLKNEKRSTTNPNVTNVNRPDNTYGANTVKLANFNKVNKDNKGVYL
ncbi:18984_t:CDS:10 [Gigaspora margarita]|uniref:18984_t:CDS:1 n=1 Tax=Gigaspora margarita TaxID=4874 RepID=A0ABN7UDW1_GIGMA|nr:18984_t:CDS:10 [Gigaspora margarita]